LPPAPDRSSAEEAILQPGDLIGLIDHGTPQLAVVQRIRGSRADIHVGPMGRSATLSLRRLDRLAPQPCPGSEPAATTLASPWRLDVARLRASLPARRELAAAWLLLHEQPATPLSLHDFSALVASDEDLIPRAAIWLWLQGDQTLFRWHQGALIPLALSEIRKIRLARRRRNLDAAARQRWVALLRNRQPLEGNESLSEAQLHDLALLRDWASGVRREPLPERLQQDLQQAHCAIEPGSVRHLLVDLGRWPRHHLPSLEGSCWQLGFSKELLDEAEGLLAEADRPRPGDARRVDLTGLHTITIDDDDTTEIDDGLSLEHLAEGSARIWIHVADPGRLIAPDSPLDLEARRRASSLYLAQGSLPMFPPRLATGPLSLRRGERCAAWSLGITLDAQGGIDEVDLQRSWVRPDYRLSYDDVNELIELAPPQERDLLRLHELMQRRRSWRIARGALILDQAEGRVRCRDTQAGFPTAADRQASELEIVEPGPGRTLVAEAMILAGAAIAEFGRREGLALPYRSQPVCTLPPEQELSALPHGPVRHAALKRCLSRGHLGSSPAPHFSLALEAYVQATSPIRRYADLLVQRQLGCWLEGIPPLDAAALDALLAQIEAPVRQGIAISRDDQRHWRQVWFEQHPRLEWRATFLRWLRPQDQLGLVHFEELAFEMPAHCPPRSEPGDALLVKVRELDSLRDLLRLEARR
jgi:exoribonuclease-2